MALESRSVLSFSGTKFNQIRLDPERPGGPLRGRDLQAVLAPVAAKQNRKPVSPSSITEYENLRNKPEPWALRQLADALGVHPREMCDVEPGKETLTDLRCWAGLSRQDVRDVLKWKSEHFRIFEEGGPTPPSWKQAKVVQTLTALYKVSKDDFVSAWNNSRDLHSNGMVL